MDVFWLTGQYHVNIADLDSMEKKMTLERFAREVSTRKLHSCVGDVYGCMDVCMGVRGVC